MSSYFFKKTYIGILCLIHFPEEFIVYLFSDFNSIF